MARLVRLRAVDRPVAVHVHLSDGGSLRREGSIVQLADRLGIPTVVTIHASELDDVLAFDRRRFASVLAHADVVHVLGDRHAAKVRSVLAARSELIVIPNCVELPELPAPAGDQRPVAVFGGELGTRKGTDVLLDAWRLVHDRRPDAILRLAGPLRDLPEPRQDAVEWLGPQPRSRMTDALRSCRVAVLPSRREAMPMFLLEAMSLARPVVATPVGDVTAAVPPDELVPVDNAEALAEKLLEFIDDRDSATTTGIANRAAIAARFSTEVVIPQFDAVYLRLAGTT